MDLTSFSLQEIERFILIFGRLVGFIVAFPFWDRNFFPVRAKIGMAFFLTLIIFPFVNYNPEFTNVVQIFYWFSLEALVGILIGLFSRGIMYSASIGGMLADFQATFMMTRIMDPFYNFRNTVTAELLFVTFMVLFLSIDGHHFLLETAVESFQYINLTSPDFLQQSVFELIVDLLAYIFVLGIKISAPMFVSLLVLTLVLGLVAKTVPQLNVFIVGIPLKIGTLFFVLYISLPAIRWAFREGWSQIEVMLESLVIAVGS